MMLERQRTLVLRNCGSHTNYLRVQSLIVPCIHSESFPVLPILHLPTSFTMLNMKKLLLLASHVVEQNNAECRQRLSRKPG